MKDCNLGIKNEFLKEVKICCEYIKEWISNFGALNCFKLILLNGKIKRTEVSSAVQFLTKEVKDIIVGNNNFTF